MHDQRDAKKGIGNNEVKYISKITKFGLLSSLAAAFLATQQENKDLTQVYDENSRDTEISYYRKSDLSPVIESFRTAYKVNNAYGSSEIQLAAHGSHRSHSSHASHSSHQSHYSSSGGYSVPSPLPTAVPTPRPTPSPTAAPTIRPTPSPAPTAAPTLRPTPSPAPTSAPTTTPTPSAIAAPTATPMPSTIQTPSIPAAVSTITPTPSGERGGSFSCARAESEHNRPNSGGFIEWGIIGIALATVKRFLRKHNL